MDMNLKREDKRNAEQRCSGRRIINGVLRCFLFLMIIGSMSSEMKAQQTSIRTNLMYWLTTTPNAGVETRIAGKSTIAVSMGYNPFKFPEPSGAENPRNPKLSHWIVVPEYKYWLCRPYEQWFFGLYGMYGKYNIGGIAWPSFLGLSDSRYKGDGIGGGLSVGYQWAFGGRWGIEASLGVGYLYLNYREYECGACGEMKREARRHFVGPTKAAVSLVYYIK